jgi:hypothetical protein
MTPENDKKQWLKTAAVLDAKSLVKFFAKSLSWSDYEGCKAIGENCMSLLQNASVMEEGL